MHRGGGPCIGGSAYRVAGASLFAGLDLLPMQMNPSDLPAFSAITSSCREALSRGRLAVTALGPEAGTRGLSGVRIAGAGLTEGGRQAPAGRGNGWMQVQPGRLAW